MSSGAHSLECQSWKADEFDSAFDGEALSMKLEAFDFV
jgi:hypothetical protein